MPENNNTPSYNDSQPCDSCSIDCEDSSNSEGSAIRYCRKHKIEMGLYSGFHYCLEHSTFHCNTHWKECLKDFGNSVMERRRTTKFQLKKRAAEIEAEHQEELRKYEVWIDQIKTRRFICAECSQVACICDITTWKPLESRTKQKAKKLDKEMKARDLSFMKKSNT